MAPQPAGPPKVVRQHSKQPLWWPSPRAHTPLCPSPCHRACVRADVRSGRTVWWRRLAQVTPSGRLARRWSWSSPRSVSARVSQSHRAWHATQRPPPPAVAGSSPLAQLLPSLSREQFLQRRHSAEGSARRISVERVVSGGGIAATYEFLAQRFPADVNQTVAAQFGAARLDEKPVVVSRSSHSDKLCKQAMDLFFRA
jgi:hypothetical protein